MLRESFIELWLLLLCSHPSTEVGGDTHISSYAQHGSDGSETIFLKAQFPLQCGIDPIILSIVIFCCRLVLLHTLQLYTLIRCLHAQDCKRVNGANTCLMQVHVLESRRIVHTEANVFTSTSRVK